MRGAHSSSEPVLASSLTSVGPSDQDGMPSAVGLCLDRARSLSTPGSEQDDSQLAASDYEGWRERHPCLLTNFEEFRQQLHGRRLAVFLDYDGTLTPIVSNPDEAVMSEQMRDAVRKVAGMFPTAIISGRGREKVESFVQLPELYYAGSHGMDIVGPRGAAVNGAVHSSSIGGGDGKEPFRFQAAAEYQPLVDRVYHQLWESLSSIPGASVEHNKFCVSAHYRNCHPDSWQRVVAAVEAVVSSTGGGRLHITRGRKVLEVRPTVDWDKGSALLHLLDVLGLSGQPDVTAIYLGDDKTDEDAFAALTGAGVGTGILVSTVAKPTAAAFTLRDPAEVLQLLQQLLTYGAGEGNGWHTYEGHCNGWAPSFQVAACDEGQANGQGGASSRQEQQGQQQQQQQQADCSGRVAAAHAGNGLPAVSLLPKQQQQQQPVHADGGQQLQEAGNG